MTFTPGPWLCASGPSMHGWPVVAPHAGGRLICRLNHASKHAEFGAQPGDRKFNAECKANGLLIAAAPIGFEAAILAYNYLVNAGGTLPPPGLGEPSVAGIKAALDEFIRKARGEQ